MDVKLFSRPMAAILNRLRRYDDLYIIPWGGRVIFEQPVEKWPIVDFFICFYSAGFPLAKAEEYVQLRNPICINDVPTEFKLLDRIQVYETLKSAGIPTPIYEIAWDKTHHPTSDDNRQRLLDMRNEEPTQEELLMIGGQGDDDSNEDQQRQETYWGPKDPLEENEDSITVNGHKFKKPFVEKPIFAEDHNIYIYYPKSSGGGSKRLFRKIGDRSSRFYPKVSTVRRGQSFIYEEFVSTDGADIKVYTVGPDYAHAEARVLFPLFSFSFSTCLWVFPLQPSHHISTNNTESTNCGWTSGSNTRWKGGEISCDLDTTRERNGEEDHQDLWTKHLWL